MQAPSHPPELLHYFMTHAPAEPQPWFHPEIAPLPNKPIKPRDMTKVEAEECAAWNEHVINAEEIKSPRVQDYALAMEGYRLAKEEWERIMLKQRYVQWPRAWAQEMLKQLAAQHE